MNQKGRKREEKKKRKKKIGSDALRNIRNLSSSAERDTVQMDTRCGTVGFGTATTLARQARHVPALVSATFQALVIAKAIEHALPGEFFEAFVPESRQPWRDSVPAAIPFQLLKRLDHKIVLPVKSWNYAAY